MYDYQVPILISSISVNKSLDLSIQRILPFINGVFHVRKISDLADIDIKFAIIAIQHLLYYGYIVLLDIFQFSNIYTINRRATELLHSPKIQIECVNFVSRFGKTATLIIKTLTSYHSQHFLHCILH